MENQPLVSIIVITYNSSEYVKETLDSTLAQTYPNIEVIISDDCSTDNTVEICRNWIETNKKSGRIFKLIEANKNTGVAGNCNRGLQVAQGEWIKCIAGDDILLPDAIESYMRFVSNNNDINVVFAGINTFYGKAPDYTIKDHPIVLKHLFYENTKMTANKQFKILSKGYVGSGPSSFIKNTAIKEVGGFDERFPLQEDYPLYIKLSKNGYRFYLLDKVTVMWRKNSESITHSIEGKNVIFGKHKIRLIKDYKYNYQMENLDKLWKKLLSFSLYLQNKILDNGNSFKSYTSVFYYYLYRFIDPFIWHRRYCLFVDKTMRLIASNNKGQ